MGIIELTATQSYILFALVFVVSVILARIVYYIFKHPVKFVIRKSKSKLDDAIVDTIEEPIVFLIVILALYFTWRHTVIPANVHDIVRQIIWVLIILDVAYFVYGIFDLIFAKLLTPLAKNSKSKLDDQLIPVFRKVIKIIILIIAFIVALDNFGIDVAALVAGLGIGGIAIALAAKETLSSVLGSFVVLGDKPFQIGDVVRVGDHEGKIKEVGLRSSRISTWEGTEVIVPNNKISEMVIENVSKRKGIRKSILIPMHVTTKYKSMVKTKKEINQFLTKYKDIDKEHYVVINDFPSRAIELRIIYWIKEANNYEDYMKVKDNINLKAIEIMQKNKIELLGK